MTEKCGAIGALTVGGRVVGQIKCELDAGHDEAALVRLGDVIPGGYRPPGEWVNGIYRMYPPSPHAVTLTWAPETEPDLDLFDPAESFDVEVPEPPVPARCHVCGARIAPDERTVSGWRHEQTHPALDSIDHYAVP